ncbi:MAG: hypothetical protein RIQ53_2490 [Pseudomonadota bacterium]
MPDAIAVAPAARPMTAPAMTELNLSALIPEALPLPPALLGESPLWHPVEQSLYFVDIPGKALHRCDADGGDHRRWDFDSEPACCAPRVGGGLLLAMRDGLWQFDPESGRRSRLAEPPYDPAGQRYNDGKVDPQGRFWCGTIDDARRPQAALFRHDARGTVRMAEGITTSNGLAFSPDGRTLYRSDTKAHQVLAHDFDGQDGSLSRQRLFAQWAPRADGQSLDDYGGRPDGAAVDAQGRYWVAMFEGGHIACLTPEGRVLGTLRLPVRCPTMCTFGGQDLRTLYITTARHGRPADELAAQPLAGRLLRVRLPEPGLPAHCVLPT